MPRLGTCSPALQRNKPVICRHFMAVSLHSHELLLKAFSHLCCRRMYILQPQQQRHYGNGPFVSRDALPLRSICLYGVPNSLQLKRLSASNALLGLDSRSSVSAACLESLGTVESSISIDDRELLQRAISFEAEHGFANSMGKKKRFGEFLLSKLDALSLKGDKALIILSHSAQSYSTMSANDRVMLLDRVCALLGFSCVQDLSNHHTALRVAGEGLRAESHDGNVCNNHDAESATMHSDLISRNAYQASLLESHPTIMFGSSEPIELYKHDDEEESMLSSPPDAESGFDCLDGDSKESLMEASTIQALDILQDNIDKEEALSSQSNKSGKLSSIKDKPGLDGFECESGASQPLKAGRSVNRVTASDKYESWLLNKPISLVKSLSAYMRSKLDEHGLHTLRKLLQHYPRTYLNFLQVGQTVEDGQYLTFLGEIVSCRKHVATSLGILEICVASAQELDVRRVNGVGAEFIEDPHPSKENVVLHMKKYFRGHRFANHWFLQKMMEKYPLGARAAVSGKVKAMDLKNHFELKEFNVELVSENMEKEVEYSREKLQPVYSCKGGLDGKTIEYCIQRVVQDLPFDIDPLPETYRQASDLMELCQAYIGIHFPVTLSMAEKARKRLVFDDFFYQQLGLLLQRQQLADKYLAAQNLQGISMEIAIESLEVASWAPLTQKMLGHLPYKLTKSQTAAVSEILHDLRRPIPMSRLLQGDVGCGKTIVAFLALLEVIDAGFQGALMGPTEFLARQQYERLNAFLEHIDEKDRPKTALLTGSIPTKEARAIRQGIESGEIQLVVGTHSLISDSVKFAALSLAIIDEQHRFGVEQRIRLQSKGAAMNDHLLQGTTPLEYNEEVSAIARIRSIPHVLAMSATPIPRTLAFAVHGDMSLSQITEQPPGRTPVKTYALFGDKPGTELAFKMVHDEVKGGGRAFIVCAAIGESEELPHLKAAVVEFEEVCKRFSDCSCGLVHGKLKSHEKEAAMDDFKSGKTQVLVSTTVIEVGIDIPEASMMVVMNAERYGMAQLHQLRGRVGRGQKASTCVLLGSSLASLERLKILERCQDGFYLAEEDLRLRGPGDLLGKQQAGHLPEFSLARFDEDRDVMLQARKTAEDVLREHHGLEDLPRLKQELSFRQGLISLGA